MAARRWDDVRNRKDLLCQLAAKLTESAAEASSPARVADRLIALRERKFAGLAALVPDPDERGDLERWLKRSSRDAIRKALGRAMAPIHDTGERKVVARRILTPQSSPPVNRSSRTPLWLVGKRQRNDLLPTEASPPSEYMGAHLPELLNRGSLPAREIQARIGPKLRLKADDVDPGERVTFRRFEGGSLYVYLLELFDREITFRDVPDPPGPVPELRFEFEMIYTYGSGRPRKLSGNLVGDRKRWFYRFEPVGGAPTPLYG